MARIVGWPHVGTVGVADLRRLFITCADADYGGGFRQLGTQSGGFLHYDQTKSVQPTVARQRTPLMMEERRPPVGQSGSSSFDAAPPVQLPHDTRIRRSVASSGLPALQPAGQSRIRLSRETRATSSPDVIRRVKTKVLPKGQRTKGAEEEEIETDDYSLLDLILFHKANPKNEVLRGEIERRADEPTDDEIIAMFANPTAPIQLTFKALPPLCGAVVRWFKRLDDSSSDGLLALLTPVGALKFVTAFPELAPPDLKSRAGTAAKEQKGQKEKLQDEEAKARRSREEQRLAQFISMFSGLLMKFVANLPKEYASAQLVKALTRLDARFRTSVTMDDACKEASHIVLTVKLLVEAFETDLEPDMMRSKGGDVVADFKMKQQQRQRAAEKVLRRHFPKMIGCLNYADPLCVVHQRYRGSLTDGLKNEQKSVSLGGDRPLMVRVIDLHSFDIDAFLEIDSETWERWEGAGLFPIGQATKDGKIGLRALAQSLRYQMRNEKGTDETRALASRLYDAVQELLTLESTVQVELAEISGYKRSEDDDTKGDFGFLLQSSKTTEAQTKRGKRYLAGQLAATHLQLTDILHIEMRRVGVGEDAIEIALGEHQRTIGPNDESKKPRSRANTI